jgi:hypothetical protein
MWKSYLKTFFTLLVVLAPGLYFGYNGKTVEMGMAIILGGVAAVFLNIDKFSRFKFGNMEGELRQAVKEAYATIEHIKEIAAPLMIMSISNLSFAGRWSSLGISEKYQMIEQVSNGAKAIGLDNNNDINHAINVFHRLHTWDYYEYIASHYLQIEHPIFEELRSVMDRATENFISEAKLIGIIENKHSHIITPEEKEKIDDYVYYLLHRKPRRYVDNLN